MNPRILKPIITIILLLSAAFVRAQHDPVFTAFRGTVYEMPGYAQGKGFAAGLETFDSIGYIVLPQLRFLEDLPEKNFPSVGRKSNFGFYLKAEMTIDTPGCYAFTMGSDDGSILWLDGSVLLDNGKMHRWRAVKDTVALVPGEYPLNLWYYNGMGPCGIGLRAVYAGPQDGCLQETAPSGLSLFFPSDKYRITDEHQALLLELIESQQYEADKEYIITITGFADPVGGTGYNEILSLKRAEAVAGFLEQFMSPQARVTYAVKGLGECAEGEDEVTCRRVEVTVSSSAR